MVSARDEILHNVRQALNRTPQQPPPRPPDSVHIHSRIGGSGDAEVDQLLAMIGELGGKTRRLTASSDVELAVAELVRDERIQKATTWQTEGLRKLHVRETLERLGVQVVPALAGKREAAACDVGITGVDAALAESGTLVLVSSSDQPAITSLLPRIHLAILNPAALRVDLRELLDQFRNEKHFVLISGPSRTTDIEKVLALGVHGPKELYVWCLE